MNFVRILFKQLELINEKAYINIKKHLTDYQPKNDLLKKEHSRSVLPEIGVPIMEN